MQITITGSLGNIGEPLARQLIAAGHNVKAISSKPEKRNEIEALGGIAAIGSVDDTDFLSGAFSGADAVFLMVPPNFGTPDAMAYYYNIGANYVAAIKNASVKRVVHLSSWGAHLESRTGFIAGSYRVESLLDQLKGVAVTHLRPGSFYTNLYSFLEMIKRTGAIAANYGGQDKIVMVSPLDIADVAAEELTATETNKVHYVASEDLTATEIARILGAAIGKPYLEWNVLSNEAYEYGLKQANIPPHAIKMLVELGESIHNGTLREDYDLHRPEKMGTVTLASFASEFAQAFDQK